MLNDGFRLSVAPGAGPLPKKVKVRSAYVVRKGNPFAKYRPADFRFDGNALGINVSDGELESTAENELVAVVRDESFELRVTGFRTDVDLRVRAIAVEA